MFVTSNDPFKHLEIYCEFELHFLEDFFKLFTQYKLLGTFRGIILKYTGD